MGGCCCCCASRGCCCCASRGVELNHSPPFYHYQVSSEEQEPLSTNHGTAPAFSTGLLVDTNLDTSSPDTYRPPPAPLPYDASLTHPRTPPSNQESRGNKGAATIETTDSGSAIEASAKDLEQSECKVKNDTELATSEEQEVEVDKSGDLKKSSKPLFSELVEDCCPTCLEEYDAENPKIITKCEHHFHLSCILEWMERSDTCPLCDQEMVFSPNIDS